MAPACTPTPGRRYRWGSGLRVQAVAPKEFLAWLIRELSRLQPKIPEGYSRNLSQDTQDKRGTLLAGDPATISEGLQALEEAWPSGTHRAWWALEGPTHVDCALFTDDTVIFVEGKRTEMGPSEAIIWYPTRNQVLRNLECARTQARLHGLKHYFVILAVEGPETQTNTAVGERMLHHGHVTDPATVEASLPHLAPSERADLLEHYLGVTTWQTIVHTFGLPPLP